jgi:hypothetical protein
MLGVTFRIFPFGVTLICTRPCHLMLVGLAIDLILVPHTALPAGRKSFHRQANPYGLPDLWTGWQSRIIPMVWGL